MAGRPRSTISLSSVSSADNDSCASGGNSNYSTSPNISRTSSGAGNLRHSVGPGTLTGANLARSRRYRRDVLSSNAAPPQLFLDTASFQPASGSVSPTTSSSVSPRPSPRLSDLQHAPAPGSTYSANTLAPLYPSSGYFAGTHSHSHFRYGGTPFSPIQEVTPYTTPSPDVPTSSPSSYSPNDRTIRGRRNQSSFELLSAGESGAETSVPPTPRDEQTFTGLSNSIVSLNVTDTAG